MFPQSFPPLPKGPSWTPQFAFAAPSPLCACFPSKTVNSNVRLTQPPAFPTLSWTGPIAVGTHEHYPSKGVANKAALRKEGASGGGLRNRFWASDSASRPRRERVGGSVA